MKMHARQGNIRLLYLDESGFSCLPNVQRSWSPRGQAHTADASVGRKRVNVLGALDHGTTQLHFKIYDHSIRRQHVVAFLDQLACASPADKPTFVVMDNASTHHHIEPETLDRWVLKQQFVLLHLPTYSPELNLIETLWKQAKYHWRTFKSWARDALHGEVQRLLDGFGSEFQVNYA